MGKVFSERELELIDSNWGEVSEIFTGVRKGITQTRYVIQISGGEVWSHEDEDVIQMPEELVGLWIQEHERDNTRTDCCARLGINDKYGEQCEWVKVVSTTYQEL